MASPLQQPPARRKLIYFALIVLLFTMTLVVRHADVQVAGAQVQGIQAQARDLELRETELGEADLTGSTIRLTLTGSRGLVVTYLWYQSDQKKLRHEWNELELLVKSIITLQPHFINPWIFQSWNLAYNVSAESDRIRDKYFYISRGIELIAEGERRNRNSPDLRSMLGFYYRDKFGISDQANTLQCLFQMSCMDPAERDPQRFRRANGQLDLGEFEQFCANYPQFIRRLHELLYRDTPAKVIEFLADNQKIPTRYEEQRPGAPVTALAKLKPPEQQFPVVCPPFSADGNEPTPQDRLDDDIDSYVLARGWLGYALLPLPPPDPELGPGIRIDLEDFKKYRLPHRGMMIILLRQQPSQTQTGHAERLEREGWYDEKWKVAEWFAPRVVELGRKSNYALEAWERAFRMWQDHGRANGLYLDEARHKLLKERDQAFRAAAGDAAGEVPDNLPDDPNERAEAVENFKAHAMLRWYSRGRGLTNYPHFYYQSEVLSRPDLPGESALQARKLFFGAEQMAKKGAPAQAVELYHRAFPIWKKALGKYPEFRSDLDNQERTYELEMNYLLQLEHLRGSLVKRLLIIPDALAQGTGPAPQMPLWLASPMRLDQRLPAPFALPFDPKDNEPRWIAPDVVVRVRRAKKLPGLPSEMMEAGGANISGRPDRMMQQMGMGGQGAPGGGR